MAGSEEVNGVVGGYAASPGGWRPRSTTLLLMLARWLPPLPQGSAAASISISRCKYCRFSARPNHFLPFSYIQHSRRKPLSLKPVCTIWSAYSGFGCAIPLVVWGQESRVHTFVIPVGLCRLKSHTADLPFVDNTGSSSLFIKDVGLSCSLVPGFIWVSQLFNHLGAWLLPLRGNLFCCHVLISYCLIFHSLTGKVTRHQAPFISALVGSSLSFISALVGSSLSLRSWNCKISHSVSLRCLCLVCVYLFVSHCRCTIFSSCVAFVFPDFSKSCKHLTSCSHAGNISIKFLQYSECELRPFKWRCIYL